MNTSYKAIVNFKQKRIRLKEYNTDVNPIDFLNSWDIQFDTLDDEWYGLDHIDIHSHLCENGYTVNVYHVDHSKTAFNVELKIRTKPFKNWNPYIHPDTQKKMDDTTEILEEATRIVKEKQEARLDLERPNPYRVQGISKEQEIGNAQEAFKDYRAEGHEQSKKLFKQFLIWYRNLDETRALQTR